MHTPTLLSTAFTAAALIAGSAAQPIRRGSIVDDGFNSAPVSRRGSIAGSEVGTLSRRGSFVDIPAAAAAGSRRSSIAASPEDIAASRRRSLAPDDVAHQTRRSSVAGPSDIAAARRRSALEEPAARRSSLAGPADIAASRRRSLAPGGPEAAYEFPAKRSSLAPTAADIAASRRRASFAGEVPVVEEPEDIATVERRAGPADILLSRRRSATPDLAASPVRRSSAAPSAQDIAAARRRSAGPAGEGSPGASRRSSLAVPQDMKAARGRRSLGDNTPSRRSSLANELPVWRSSFGTSDLPADVVVEEDVAPEDAAPAGTAIPLHKRAENPLQDSDGSVNWKAAVAHLDHVQIKYEKGIIAHQTNKGEPLLDAKHYSPEELQEREQRLARRSEGVPDETDGEETSSDEDSLPTVEEDFMAGASEFSVGNPNLVAFKTKTNTASTKAGSVQLTDYNNDLLWAGPVQIGSNSQTFILDFDTGSADTWVPSSSCKSSNCANHNKYNPSSSSTSDLVDSNTLNIEYGDGSTTSGKVYTDNLTVGGMTATDQTIGVATSLSASFKNDPHDGIMGMGYQSISQMNAPPVFQTLMKQNKVKNSQFSFNLDSGKGSELYLGGANSAKYQGKQEWHDVVSESYWVLEGNAQVDGESASDSFYAIIDTGTTVVVAPTAQAKEFWSNVDGAQAYQGGYYTFPCENTPEVSFSFGGKQWEMSQDNINLGSTYSGSDRCVGSIVGMDVGVSAWILGDAFLKDVYTTFDLDENRVGFAEKSDS